MLDKHICWLRGRECQRVEGLDNSTKEVQFHTPASTPTDLHCLANLKKKSLEEEISYRATGPIIELEN